MKKTAILSQADMVKAEINRLERRGGKDWQSLIKQVERNYKPIILNPLQVIVSLLAESRPSYKKTEKGWTLNIEASRGAGKSTLISDYMRRTVKSMPRSINILQGETYQQILTRTFPSTIHGLEMFGIFQGLHYFVGRTAPKSWRWDIPYKPPLKWDKVIHFWTGACYVMTSQDITGDGRSLNADSRIADEAALLNKAKLDSDSGPAVRGSNIRAFQNSSMLLHEMFVSTTPITEDGFWFVEQENHADEELAELELVHGRGLVPLHERSLFYLKASNRVNANNLPKDYNEKARKTTLKMIFEAEYLNIRPKVVTNGFYSLLDPDIHCYNDYNYDFYDRVGKAPDCRGDNDLVPGVPLLLGVDWGATINCLTVNQHLKHPVNEYRTLKSMYVLGDDGKIQDDLFDSFHDYYQFHNNKALYIFYDNQGNVATGTSKQNRAEQAAKQLRAKGWTVHLMTVGGRNEAHDLTFRTWGYLLRGDHPGLPKYLMNKGNCKELYVSMRNARSKEDNNGIHKDKSSERSKKVLRPYATDHSDANDKPIIHLFSRIATSSQLSLPPIRMSSQ